MGRKFPAPRRLGPFGRRRRISEIAWLVKSACPGLMTPRQIGPCAFQHVIIWTTAMVVKTVLLAGMMLARRTRCRRRIVRAAARAARRRSVSAPSRRASYGLLIAAPDSGCRHVRFRVSGARLLGQTPPLGPGELAVRAPGHGLSGRREQCDWWPRSAAMRHRRRCAVWCWPRCRQIMAGGPAAIRWGSPACLGVSIRQCCAIQMGQMLARTHDADPAKQVSRVLVQALQQVAGQGADHGNLAGLRPDRSEQVDVQSPGRDVEMRHVQRQPPIAGATAGKGVSADSPEWSRSNS